MNRLQESTDFIFIYEYFSYRMVNIDFVALYTIMPDFALQRRFSFNLDDISSK